MFRALSLLECWWGWRLAGVVADYESGVRGVEEVEPYAWVVSDAVLKDDLFVWVYDYGAVVELICNGRVTIS